MSSVAAIDIGWLHYGWIARAQMLELDASWCGDECGEAEFYGAVKGASTGLGMKALYRDIGYELPLRLWTDSSAAVGICSIQGLGKLRHLECMILWIQQRIRHGELLVIKIAGEFNPADLLHETPPRVYGQDRAASGAVRR